MLFLLFIDEYVGSLGFELARFLGMELVSFESKFFGDGEYYFRVLSDVSGVDVFVVLSMFPDPSFSIVRGLFYVSTFRDLGARRVVLVSPYLAYSRQDKRFLDGECVSSRVVVKSFINAGADLVVSVDVHNPEAFKDLGDHFINLSSQRVYVDFIRKQFDVDDIFFVSPDKGRFSFVKSIAESLNAPFLYFEKQRDLKTGRIIKHVPSNSDLFSRLIEERNIAIVMDDIISTGGTISNIARSIREQGFNGRIITLFTHGLFLPGSIKKLYESGVSEIIATDTVKNPFAKITVAPILGEFIRSLNHNKRS